MKYFYCAYTLCTVNIFCNNLIKLFLKVYFKIYVFKNKHTICKFPTLALGGNFDFPIILVLRLFYVCRFGSSTRVSELDTGCG